MADSGKDYKFKISNYEVGCMLPKHGKINCRVCFDDAKEKVIKPAVNWRMVNDPGAWGSQTPEYLVLGFSKGATQAGLYENGKFEDVAFANMRDRLTSALIAVGILPANENVTSRISNPNSSIAFGSLVRCSVSRAETKNGILGGYSCTGPIIGKSFKEIPEIIANCSEKYLRDLPKEIRVVVMLGNSDQYVKAVKKLLKAMFEDSFCEINDMAVKADGKVWVHVAHPSGLNGHFNTWLTSNSGPGLKRHKAIAGIAEA